jgi:hypothetical protein
VLVAFILPIHSLESSNNHNSSFTVITKIQLSAKVQDRMIIFFLPQKNGDRLKPSFVKNEEAQRATIIMINPNIGHHHLQIPEPLVIAVPVEKNSTKGQLNTN